MKELPPNELVAYTTFDCSSMFRDPIKAFIFSVSNKAKKISYLGANIDLGSANDIILGDQTHIEAKQQHLLKAYQSSIITEEESIIRKQLSEAGFPNEKAITVLINHLANQNLLIKILIIDNIIYSEQIELLYFVNNLSKPARDDQLQKFYDQWKGRNQSSNYAYENFIKFLLDQNLLYRDNIGDYTISIYGKEYLSFFDKDR